MGCFYSKQFKIVLHAWTHIVSLNEPNNNVNVIITQCLQGSWAGFEVWDIMQEFHPRTVCMYVCVLCHSATLVVLQVVIWLFILWPFLMFRSVNEVELISADSLVPCRQTSALLCREGDYIVWFTVAPPRQFPKNRGPGVGFTLSRRK